MNRCSIKTFLLSLLTVAAFFATGCATDSTQSASETHDTFIRAEGDSTIYALVAAGTNDSILVYLSLPYAGADPDTVDVFGALQNRKIFGRPEVGDNVAIVIDSVAACVINIEKLTGNWCYEVLPHLRHKLGDGPLPDRLQQMLNERREYGMLLKSGGMMYSIGARRRAADEQLPVEYPLAKNYGQWAIYNGHLLLSEVERDTAGVATVIGTDTTDFVRLGRDTLVLRFPDGEKRRYYRKHDAEEQGTNQSQR